jgi:hypothetical protein
MFVTEPDKKAALAERYRRVFSVAYSPDALGQLDATGERVRQSAQYLADHLHEVPVMMIPCQWTRPGADAVGQAAYWGSILPAVWSFLLAARSRGLGSVWTTMHLVYEREAAEILGIPYERCAQAGLFRWRTRSAPTSRRHGARTSTSIVQGHAGAASASIVRGLSGAAGVPGSNRACASASTCPQFGKAIVAGGVERAREAGSRASTTSG